MELQAILDQFEFRPDPETALTRAVTDLRGAVRVLSDAVDDGATATTAAELESALRTSRDRIETCYGIIEAHGFAGPIVDGSTALTADDLEWADIDRVVGDGEDVTDLLSDVFVSVPTGDAGAVRSRIEADRLDLLASVPDRLPDPAGDPPTAVGDLRAAFLLATAVAYFVAGFGMHPAGLDPDTDRVFGGYWLLAAVIVGIDEAGD